MTTREDIEQALDMPLTCEALSSPSPIYQHRKWLRWQQERIAELEAALREQNKVSGLIPSVLAALEADR